MTQLGTMATLLYADGLSFFSSMPLKKDATSTHSMRFIDVEETPAVQKQVLLAH
jgi:hypothetical protein